MTPFSFLLISRLAGKWRDSLSLLECGGKSHGFQTAEEKKPGLVQGYCFYDLHLYTTVANRRASPWKSATIDGYVCMFATDVIGIGNVAALASPGSDIFPDVTIEIYVIVFNYAIMAFDLLIIDLSRMWRWFSSCSIGHKLLKK